MINNNKEDRKEDFKMNIFEARDRAVEISLTSDKLIYILKENEDSYSVTYEPPESEEQGKKVHAMYFGGRDILE